MDELNEIIEQLELAKSDLSDYLDTLDEDDYLREDPDMWQLED